MKKALLITLVLLLLFPIVSMAAQKIDLSTYTVEELIELKTAIDSELIDRGATKSANIPTGDYVVGQDFPAGTYTITTSEYMVAITLNDYEELYTVTPESPVGRVVLEDGVKFSTTGKITLTQYTGITFG